ncbi:MAG: hypothetical protein QM811_13655 [Pirellulales bacterium]
MNWREDGDAFLVGTDFGSWRLAPKHPESGLAFQDLGTPSRLIGGVPAAQGSETDVYRRGADVVATYFASLGRPTRIQIYWRLRTDAPQGIALACEQIVSVQTHLLGISAALLCVSKLGSNPATAEIDGEDFTSDMRPNGYRQWFHPAARSICEIDSESSTSTRIDKEHKETLVLRRTLFPQELEKGVILRARMLHVWSKPDADAEELAAYRNAFREAEPILTT